MRAHVPDPSTPRCPDCGSRHYPATLHSGERRWCKGTPLVSMERDARHDSLREGDPCPRTGEPFDGYSWSRELPYDTCRACADPSDTFGRMEHIDQRGSLARARHAIREVMRHEHARRMLYCGLPIDPNTEKGSLPDRI